MAIADTLSNTAEITSSEIFTLEILHTSDQEAGIPALQDAIGLSAVMNALEADPQYENTVKLTSGDVFIAGPFFNASRDIYDIDGEAGNKPGIADILIQNELGWDAAAIGNHEFDAGAATFLELLAPNPNLTNGTQGGEGLGSTGYLGALFPYLSSNLDFSRATLPTGLRVVEAGQAPQANSLTSSVVLDVNGESVGVIGAVTPYLPSIANISPVTMKTPATTQSDSAAVQAERLADNIQPLVDSLTSQGIDKIILMTHLQEAGIEQALAQSKLKDVDVIIGGGSHRVMADPGTTLRGDETQAPPQLLQPYPQPYQNTSEQTVYYVNTGANYRYLSRLIVDFDENGVITRIGDSSGTYATDTAGVNRLYPEEITTFEQVKAKADPEVVAIVDGVANFVNQLDGTIFGNTTVFLNGIRGDVRTQETNLGNLTADANRWYAEQYGFNIDISFKNGGGIRDQIGRSFIDGGTNELIQAPPDANPAVGKEQGDVSGLDISNSLRFDNLLSVGLIGAEGLKHLAEHMVARSTPGNTPGQFGQIGGFRFSFDVSGQAIVFANNQVTTPGTRIRSLIVEKDNGIVDVVVRDGEVVGDPNRLFTMVTLDFLAQPVNPGDGYPSFLFQNIQKLADLETPPNLNRADLTEGGEQDALAEYFAAIYPNPENAYNEADTPVELDTRIQNLSFRNDTVLESRAGVGIFNIELLSRSEYAGVISIDPIFFNNLPLTRLYDETYYLSENPDVQAGVNDGVFESGYEHYTRFGLFEGRDPSTLYDEAFYLAQNPDVAGGVNMGIFQSGFEHYATFGQLERRDPSAIFDELDYLNNNPDVMNGIAANQFRSGFEHYLRHGLYEGRLPLLSLYDETYYLTQNPDVAEGVADGLYIDGFDHYLRFGQGEQRNPSSLFSEGQYLATYSDVADAVTAGIWQSGFQHYILFGRAEERSTSI
jgi:2',3'-cyclic-nucleotide 2'-phosphodiesterase (5'-nucleotidase family)